MGKKKSKKLKRTKYSDKIEVNVNKVYAISDILQLAATFFPAKNATHRRAAFIAIWNEIKNAPDQKLPSFEEIPGKYDLSNSAIKKSWQKMYRIGLIHRSRYGWGFSSRFKNTLEKLLEKLELYKIPVANLTQKKGEMIWVGLAKGEEDLEKRYETETKNGGE